MPAIPPECHPQVLLPPQSIPAVSPRAKGAAVAVGRDAAVGSSLRVDRAVMLLKPAIDSGRAGATLVETLRGLEDACREMGDDYLGTMRKTGRAVLKLEAEKLSLPPAGTAGRFDVSALRSPELREAFLDPSTIATKVAIPKGPRIGSRVTEAWLNVLARLDACGILRLACERELPRGFAGEDLKSGLFTRFLYDFNSCLQRRKKNVFSVETRVVSLQNRKRR